MSLAAVKTTMDQDFALLKGVELTSLRTIAQKTFDLGKGRRQAVSYGEPVHFLSAGKLIDIDNHLFLDEKNNVLRTTANAYDTELTYKDDGKAIITLTRDGIAFPLSYLGETTGAVGEILEPEEHEHASEQEARADLSATLHSGVRYTELRPGMDVEIHIDGRGIKDDIILKTPEALSYACLVLPEGFEYRQDKNGNTHAYCDGKDYITILAPCAVDAKGKDVAVEAVLDDLKLRYEIAQTEEAVFPIIIDPCISYSDTANAMESAYVYSGQPTTNYRSNYLRVGVVSGTEYLSLIKPTTLVGQRASDTIINAELHIKAALGEETEPDAKDRYTGAYPIKCAWSENSVTWNDMTPSGDTHISTDMRSYVCYVKKYYWCSYDITESYRQWYTKDSNAASTIHGVALRHAGCGVYKYTEYQSTRVFSGKPYIVVNYVSHAGRKGWWKYETMGSGRAGAVYTDIYNGNLIAEHADTATTGSRMPVCVSHIYNSCLSDDNSAYCGLGWRLSLNQNLRKETILSQEYYIWQDSDGTEHYFEKTGDAPYSDSEGMQLELAVNNNDITITDKSDTVMTFPLISASERVYLTSVADAHGNTMTLAYDINDAGKVVSATDGVGRVTALAYNSDGLLSSITAPGCPVVSYTYSGNNTDGWLLYRVNYSDLSNNQYTEYSYDTYDNTRFTATLTRLKNFDGVQTDIVYDTELDTTVISNYCEQTRKVISLEQSNGALKGAKKLIKYGHMHTAIKFVTDTESDANGKEIKYHFNNAGNVISSHDELWHAVAVEYDSGIDNTPSATSTLIKSVINRLPNTDLSSGWTVTKAYASDTSEWKNDTLCMSMPSRLVTKRGAGELKNSINASLFKSGTYTFSVYLKTTGLTVASGYQGAFLRVTANGNTYESRPAISSTEGIGTGTFAEGWERLHVSFPFTYGSDTGVTVELVCDASAGALYWSCPQLEEGSLANHFNMLSDGDFSLTKASAGRLLPDRWTLVGSHVTDSLQSGIVTDRAVTGIPGNVSGNAMRFGSSPALNNVYVEQEIRARGLKDSILTLSGWCCAESVGSGHSNFQPRMIIRFLDETLQTPDWTPWQYVLFSTQRSGWHCVSSQVVAPKNYARVRVGVMYNYNDNAAMFTHISLARELYGSRYTYDANCNLIGVKELTNQDSTASYDDFHNLLSYVQPGSASNEKYLYTYGDTEAEQKRHLPLTSTTPEGVKTATTYDSYGNALTSTIQENATAPLIRTETEYTANGNYDAKQKDARGNEVTNTLDANGKVLSVTDPAGQSVGYTYDSSNRVTKVETVYMQDGQSRTSKNEYTYENDLIRIISHNTTDNNTNDVRYTFNYDSLGRKTSVTVSNGQSGATEQPLSTNVYRADRKSRLEEVQYGNGGKVKYSYDDFDRVTGITHDNDTDPKFTYEYDAKGRAAVVKDTTDGSTIRNNYDQTDRPTESEQRDGNDSLKYRTFIEYDVKNRVKAFNESTADATHKTEYTYDKDNRPTEVKYNGSNSTKVNYIYDKLNRVTSRTVTNGAVYATTFGYVQGATAYGSNATTTLVQSITQGSGANALNFSYTYDSRGNITSETKNGVTTTYEYDALGQLTRVNDPNDPTAYNEGGLSNNGTTWIYTYDRGGNILSKAAYEFTTGIVGTAVRTWLYEYGDANWKDKLTKFDGNTITYDDIGNPLNDDTWTYVWQAGRQLKSMSKTENGNTVIIEFSYNYAGIRTKKVRKVNSVVTETTEYILNGKYIVDMIHTDHLSSIVHAMHFYYDAQGNVILVDFNGAKYSYIHNLQGDVIGLMDGSGNLVVQLKYDSWGKPTSLTGSMASTLGELEPFGYRGYVWDKDTDLYYLRSRYYSASVSRFINSDTALTSTSISTNIWYYCNNNPVCLLDDDGFDPWGKIAPDWGYIHRAVQDHLAQRYHLHTEVSVVYTDKDTKKDTKEVREGRIDLLACVGRAYEVKPNNPRAIEKGKKQLENYISGTLKKPEIISPNAKLQYGGKKFDFHFTTKDGRFDVHVITIGDGIIAYNFEAIDPDDQKKKESFGGGQGSGGEFSGGGAGRR